MTTCTSDANANIPHINIKMPTMSSVHWCAILIAHQLLWQNMEAPVSIFQESSLVGEPRERLSHIHSANRYQLSTK